MRFRVLQSLALLAASFAASPAAPQAALPAPGFHHLHLNSTNPDAAIAFYVRQFPSTSKSTWGGMPALASPNNVLVLFNRVNAAPAADPEATAFWHFGWHVTDVRQNLQIYQGRPDVTLAPLYTGDAGGSVFVSSDTWPGTGGVLGLTQAQIADAKSRGVQPLRGAGFAYLRGPDNALIEYQGNMPAERFNHVHLHQEDPFCAQAWYRRHLNAPLPANAQPRTEADCKVTRGPDRSWPALNREGMFRTPTAGVLFGDVSMNWYMRQGAAPLLPTRGRLMDHIALSVANLDAWVAKLRSENVKFLEQEYRLGDTRAVMIEGPSREAIELVEIK
jgi:catechol 2,3-dioxygenase-like lactoylglutathione lyase family enzyme